MTAALIRVAPWLALVLVSWFGGCQYQKNRDAAARIAGLEQERERLAIGAYHTDTVYVTDTLRLGKWKTRYDTARYELKLHLDDKVKIQEYLVITDSVIYACEKTVETCAMRVAYRDSIIATLDSMVSLQKSKSGNWKSKLGWLLAGAAAGTIIAR